jgi:hypothetical protein
VAKPHDPLDNPIFFREFLKCLTHWDAEYDAGVIKSLCDTFNIEARTVMARLKTYYTDPPPARMQ